MLAGNCTPALARTRVTAASVADCSDTAGAAAGVDPASIKMLPLVPKHRVFDAYAAAAAAADTLVYNGGTTSLDAVSDPFSRVLL